MAHWGAEPQMGCTAGPQAPRFDRVRRIAVLRGGGLGDVLFAVPAIEALSTAYPDAAITLLGTPLHAELFAGRPGPVTEVVVLPFADGVRPGPADDGRRDAFLAELRERRFDLAVQLHGGGRHSNPFLLALGARHTVGCGTPDAAPLERTVPYRYYQHEVLRALEVAGLAGAPAVGLAPRLAVTASDRAAADAVLAAVLRGSSRPRVVLHAGATDQRRRWPLERFALLARWASEDGFDVLLVGDQGDRELAEGIARLAAADDRAGAAASERRQPAGAWGTDRGRRLDAVRPVADGSGAIVALAGRHGLDALVGLLAGADVLVGNDSGPRHLAQAVGTPSVGIYWIGNALMAAPLERSRHRVQIGWVTDCPVCGHSLTRLDPPEPDCGHAIELTGDVRAQDVYADLIDLYEGQR